MREEFRADLHDVSRLLVAMAEAVRAAMRQATTALLQRRPDAAEAVIARDAEVDELYQAGRGEGATTCSPGRRRSPPTCAW